MQPMLVRRLIRIWQNEGAGGLSRRVLDRLGLEQPGEPEATLARYAAEYWSSSACDEALRDLSHWKGHGRFADEVRWRSIGEKHVQLARHLLHLAERDTPINRVVEWGPGGGSNAVAFAPTVKHFIGIDISRPNLNECASRLAEIGFDAFLPVCIDPADLDSVVKRVTAPCDLFLSTAAFQHFPSKDYGARVMKIAAILLAPNGVALVQIRYDDGNPAYRSKRRDYKRNAISFTSYRIESSGRLRRVPGSSRWRSPSNPTYTTPSLS